MRATGIVRKLDSVGRLVLPSELRCTLDVKEGDPMEIFTGEGQIYLKKYAPCCIFCGEANGILSYGGKNICRGCMENLKEI